MSRSVIICAAFVGLYLLYAWVFGLPPLAVQPTSYCETGENDFAMAATFSEGGRKVVVEMRERQSGALTYRGASWFTGDTYSDGVVTFSFDPEPHVVGLGASADCHGG